MVTCDWPAAVLGSRAIADATAIQLETRPTRRTLCLTAPSFEQASDGSARGGLALRVHQQPHDIRRVTQPAMVTRNNEEAIVLVAGHNGIHEASQQRDVAHVRSEQLRHIFDDLVQYLIQLERRGDPAGGGVQALQLVLPTPDSQQQGFARQRLEQWWA